MKIKYTILSVIIFYCIAAHSQSTSKQTDTLGRRLFGFSLQNKILSLQYFDKEKFLIFHYGFNPKVSYYPTEHISIGLSYLGWQTYYSNFPEENQYYNNAELDLSYFFKEKGRVFFYLEAGYMYGEYRPYRSHLMYYKKEAGAMARIGGGFVVTLNKAKTMSLNFAANIYVNLNKPATLYSPPYQTLAIGFNYYLRKKRK